MSQPADRWPCASSSRRSPRRSTPPRPRTRTSRSRSPISAAAQLGARQQGRGAGALSLGVLRPPARDPRRPAGHPRRRRPLRVPVGSAVQPRQRRSGRRRQARNSHRWPGAERHLGQDPAATSTGCWRSTAIPTSGRSTRCSSARIGSFVDARAVGGRISDRAGQSSRPPCGRRLRRISSRSTPATAKTPTATAASS